MKHKLKKDVNKLLKDFIDGRMEEQFNKKYTGIVEDNNDPEQLGRCKIRVYGIFGDEIPTDDIPWAVQDLKFVGSKKGSFVVPPLDAIVNVYFDQGDIYKPVYTTKVYDKNNLPVGIDEDYPDTMVLFETDEGEQFKINRKTNETTYTTASGVVITIDGDGNVTLDTKGSDSGTVTVEAGGNVVVNGGSEIQLNGTAYNIARGQIAEDLWTKLNQVLVTSWVPVPMDGGASLKAVIASVFAPAFVTNINVKGINSTDNKIA